MISEIPNPITECSPWLPSLPSMLRCQINLANMVVLANVLLNHRPARMVRCLSTGASVRPALSILLKNPSLFGTAASKTTTKSCFYVYNPADPSSPIADVTSHGQDDARQAIERSHAFLSSWRDGTTAPYRSNLLLKWSRLIQENAEDIATIMTIESGKPLQESRGEVGYGVSFIDFYAAEALRPSSAGGGFLVPTPFSYETGAPRGQIIAMQQAVGVCALIAPWNFPIAMVRRTLRLSLRIPASVLTSSLGLLCR
jgi:delta 1-pyrroline-5-carboxylate dehydrogenase